MRSEKMEEDREFLDNIRSLDAALTAGDELAGIDAGDLCAKYRSIKGTLTFLLPIIKKIPVYGKTIAGAIEMLMGIADKLCPSS